MRPARGLLLVKPVETADSLNGIVLLDETRQRWTGQQCEVLEVGATEYCDDEDCERPHIHTHADGFLCLGCEQSKRYHKDDWGYKEGDWLLVRPRCFVATDEDKVWVCKQSDVLAKLVLEPDPGVPGR